MDFLSTGEKIKRARIYKGLTLKQLCEEDISISRMSCIENGKVKADRWVLELVAKRLNLDLEYLLCDDITQLNNSIEKYVGKKILTENESDEIKEYLEYSLSKEYDEISAKLMHILFMNYTNLRDFRKAKELLNEYSSIYESNKSNKRVYYEDLALYFTVRKNFADAITYYNMLLDFLLKDGIEKKDEIYIKNATALAICNYRVGQIDKSNEILRDIFSIEGIDINNKYLGEAQGVLATIALLNENIDEFEKNYNQYKNKVDCKAYNWKRINSLIIDAFLKNGNYEEAQKFTEESINKVDKEDKIGYIELLLFIINVYNVNGCIESVKEYCELSLELAINKNNMFFIERSYYFKAQLSRNEKNDMQWEMYMNLATDLLLKFGTYEEKRARYLEMADLYHYLDDTNEALKYLSFAIKEVDKLY
ncbi:helix-turn-helix transcriptional regulator [Clostridium sp. LIBA-8841]|uniref:helix-turn-helix domain-containing protein n=1 Tax=Clostridium sp. LIBA-8841 TaxID=2987530 RepID=UPI002AC69C2A|nr:helix-turn-helix transcriptional regulator [Clostridium sp. LIBA-8841]MDZ5252345.1 helix-turn-helix domain-containing protein [Clostridium sp. LIBA-8841]